MPNVSIVIGCELSRRAVRVMLKGHLPDFEREVWEVETEMRIFGGVDDEACVWAGFKRKDPILRADKRWKVISRSFAPS